jgi:serine protease Do
VEPGSPADRAELERGLVVVEANGQVVTSAGDLTRILKAAKPGSIVTLRAQVGSGDQAAKRLFALEVP